MKRLLPVLLILLLGLWYIWPASDEEILPARTPSPVTTQSKIVSNPTGGRQPDPKSNTIASISEPRSTLADTLNSPATDIRADLRVVAEILDTFRSNFPQLGNPVGNNPEITAVLTGKNKLRLALIPPDHPAINRDGELCDRWGTPFFFHSESATKMEIRSAGPDKKMWTSDDVALGH